MEGVNDQSPNAATLHTTEGKAFQSIDYDLLFYRDVKVARCRQQD